MLTMRLALCVLAETAWIAGLVLVAVYGLRSLPAGSPWAGALLGGLTGFTAARLFNPVRRRLMAWARR